jgi:hypothetical protein
MATVDQQWVQVPMTAEAQAIVGMPMKQPAAHSGTYAWHLDTVEVVQPGGTTGPG